MNKHHGNLLASSLNSNYDKHKIFIHNALKVVPNGEQNNFVLMNMLQRHSDAVTAFHCDVLQLCRLCGNNYYEDQKHLELLPPSKLNRFLRRLRKINFASTPYQLSCNKKLKNSFKSQTIVKTCNFCNNKRRNDILKPVVVNAEKELKKSSSKKIRRNKKLKKTARFAGLNEAAVLSAKKQNPVVAETINAFTPKRGIIEDSIIVLDTPQNKNWNNISPIVLDTPFTEIENTPKKIQEKNDIINLITPITINKNSGSKTRTPKRSLKNANVSVTPKSNNNIPTFVTPKSTKDKSVDSVTNTLSSKKHEKISKLTPKKAKNKILASDTNKKANKRNSFANLLKENSKANKTIANLEQFLKSI